MAWAQVSEEALTEAEWRTLAAGPQAVLELVGRADGTLSESDEQAFDRFCRDHMSRLRFSDDPGVDALFDSLMDHLEPLPSVWGEADLMRAVRGSVELVESRDPDLAQVWRESLGMLAVEIASAQRAFFGLGVAIDRNERKRIEQLRRLLRLPPV